MTEKQRFIMLLAIGAVWAYFVLHYWDVMRRFVAVGLDNTWQYFVVETWYLASVLICCIFILQAVKMLE